jgi:hypothetical protein
VATRALRRATTCGLHRTTYTHTRTLEDVHGSMMISVVSLNGCLNGAPCPPCSSHGASTKAPEGYEPRVHRHWLPGITCAFSAPGEPPSSAPPSCSRPRTCSVTYFSGPLLKNVGKSQPIQSSEHDHCDPEVVLLPVLLGERGSVGAALAAVPVTRRAGLGHVEGAELAERVGEVLQSKRLLVEARWGSKPLAFAGQL